MNKLTTTMLLTLVLVTTKVFAQANTSLSNLSATAINADLNFAATGDYGVRYITTGVKDSLVLQTSTDESGFGGGFNVFSGSSVQITAGGNGNMLLSTNNADIDINSGGEVVLSPAAGHWVDIYGDGVFVGSSNGLQLAPSAAAPTCSSSFQGTLYYQAGASGVADQLQVCMKAADDTFSWKNVSF
jgi:hypothetical protein